MTALKILSALMMWVWMGGQNSSPPPVGSILDRYFESVGGTTALQKIQTRVTKGSIVTAAGTVPWVVY